MSVQETREKLPLIQSAVSQLMEHFDTVRIFATKHDAEEDTTVSLAWGGGNRYAQEGQVRQWLEVQTESSLEDEDDG